MDGRTVVSRKGGLLAKLLGRPWPNDEDVVAAVREAMQKAPEQRQRNVTRMEDDKPMAIVFETSDYGLFEMAKSLLQANAIDFVTSKESLQDVIGGGRMGGLNIVAGPAQLAVPENQLERARELLADLDPDR